MTTWTELRTVALVGTERRVLSPSDSASTIGPLPTQLSAEEQALVAAALLGIGRAAGGPQRRSKPIRDGTPESSERSPVVEQTERFAPQRAVQLLELILTGNAGPSIIADSLLAQWLRRCAALDLVVPHRLLVTMLDRATTPAVLRDEVRAVVGHRGHWLAARRDKWAWAVAPPSAVDDAHPAVDLDDLLELRANDRDELLGRIRAADPTQGRRLIAEACEQLDATSRARVLACLETGLGADDEDLLEAALDDRSKQVRAVAIGLLNGLTSSDHARRMTGRLEPLVSTTVRLRRALHVDYPAAPEDEQLRDLPPDGHGVIEQQWFDALVAGTPLRWWEQTLEKEPAQIVRMKSNLTDELHAAWSAAALAQHDRTWLEALFDLTRDPALLAGLGDDAAATAFLAGIADDASQQKQMAMLLEAPGPWTPAFSREALDWIRRTGDGKGAQARMNQLQLALAERLDGSTQADLTDWLDRARGEEHKPLQRTLRTIIQQLSMRANIDAAFDSRNEPEISHP